MRTFILPLLLSTALPSPALALDSCTISPEDVQARTCVYNPSQRYVAVGTVGFPVNLVFGGTEHIKRYEFAYTGADDKGNPVETWRGPGTHGKDDKQQQQPVEKDRFISNLPITPYFAGTSALVVVTTMPDGAERPYHFVLLARAAGDCAANQANPGCIADTATTSQLAFDYPADRAAEAARAAAEKKQAAIAAWRQQQANKKEQIAVARLKTDVFYGPRNKDYTNKAELKYKYLAPSEVSDNGWLTEFQWPGNIEPPAITIVDPSTGELRPADPVKQGPMYVVNTTAQRFRLLQGSKPVMDIINNRWSPQRPDPGTGTTSPDVVRTVIHEARQR
jgi:type IV secretory pathway VirB9-like protein